MTTPAESALAAAAPALAEATVLNLDGAVVRVGTLFQDRTAVLVFLRHFG